MISLYIVTYRNSYDLNRNIESVLESGADVSINVINNHSEFSLEKRFENSVNILHNRLRPDFSTGHLSRSWNQALLHGFRDLSNPASEIVVTAQDDAIFKPDWLERLKELHQRYSFITMGSGDALCSYSPEAVKKIGLWDERFCNIGYQEADYFLRAMIYNREHSSINDFTHKRLLNNVEEGEKGKKYDWDWYMSNEKVDRLHTMLITTPHMNQDRRDSAMTSMKFHAFSETVFRNKWGVSATNWTDEHHTLRKTLIPNYIMYPYFEKDVEGLREKNYVVPDDL